MYLVCALEHREKISSGVYAQSTADAALMHQLLIHSARRMGAGLADLGHVEA
jgi:hypothetical protein